MAPFLEDDERAVRLTAAKAIVAIAEAEPDAVAEIVDPLAARLGDEDEFYYVRARAAEALGYAALDHPEPVGSPEIVAELTLGLSFDEPEVRVKLAKAIECVALGDPARLRWQVASLADHLDDESERVRYHLTTALVAIGCEHPERLGEATDALVDRLDDESESVCGRAAEALGLLRRAEAGDDARIETALASRSGDGEAASFVAERLAFARNVADGAVDEVGTVAGVRATTAAAADAISSPDTDQGCPQCGATLPDNGPPMCPQCGAPY